MRIGLDFDNTIANYEGVFHAAAVERGLIPDTVGTSKNAVRDHLNGSGRKDEFTELQGYVYGARMDLVSPFPGVGDFVSAAVAAGHRVFVVSHKTRTPILGPAYDMHAAARGFLADQGLTGAGMIDAGDAYFEMTKEDKIARAAALGVEVFVDDLPEILAMAGYPDGCRRILFDPNSAHLTDAGDAERLESWAAIRTALLG